MGGPDADPTDPIDPSAFPSIAGAISAKLDPADRRPRALVGVIGSGDGKWALVGAAVSGDPNCAGHVFGLYKDTTAEEEELSPTFLRLFDDWNAREELALANRKKRREELGLANDDDDEEEIDPDDDPASTTPGARTDSLTNVAKPAAAYSSTTPASAASSSPSVEAAPRGVKRPRGDDDTAAASTTPGVGSLGEPAGANPDPGRPTPRVLGAATDSDPSATPDSAPNVDRDNDASSA